MANLFSGAITLCGQQVNNQGLADACEISKGHMSVILRGKKKASQELLKKMAQALGVDVARLERELKGRNGSTKK